MRAAASVASPVVIAALLDIHWHIRLSITIDITERNRRLFPSLLCVLLLPYSLRGPPAASGSVPIYSCQAAKFRNLNPNYPPYMGISMGVGLSPSLGDKSPLNRILVSELS